MDVDGSYLELDREAWRTLRAGEPGELSGQAGPIGPSEVQDIYLPLTRLLQLYYEASARRHEAVTAFVGEPARPVPFVIAVAGSVASGKTATAHVLRTLIGRWPQRPRTALMSTDSFLYPNVVLAERGLMDRKGFPESYDQRALLQFVWDVKAGAAEVSAPVYSHAAYDIVAGESQTVQRPDVLILEGINVLQPGPADSLPLADFIDFSVYVDAATDDIRRWFLVRLGELRAAARTDPDSVFAPLTEISDGEFEAFGIEVWKAINEVNLIENIEPTRARATVVLRKAADHAVTSVRLRRF
jgi:type I pantothenate kinase